MAARQCAQINGFIIFIKRPIVFKLITAETVTLFAPFYPERDHITGAIDEGSKDFLDTEI